MIVVPQLRKLRLELALDCPLRCLHCSATAAPGHPLAMPTDLPARLVREFAAMGGQEVTFTGGEPLVDRRLPVLLAEAAGHGLAVVVFTSGIVHARNTWADRAAAGLEALVALAPASPRAVFSLYSVNPAIHDAITQTPGSLMLTREAIRRTVAAGIRAELHFVPTSSNYRDLLPLAREAVELGVRAIRVIRYVPQGRGQAHRDTLRPNAAQQVELRDLLRAAMALDGIEVRVGSGFGYLLDGAPPCSAGADELVVAADGRIYPCSGFAAYRGAEAIGSVLEVPLADVWRDAPYLRAMRVIHATRAARHHAGGCHDGCPAQKALATGRLTDVISDPDVALLTELETRLPEVAKRRPTQPAARSLPVVSPMAGG